tara:strand:- start:7865 stop:10099 length:2235 start_codon:yes stop_codon:yes gene_type:complete
MDEKERGVFDLYIDESGSFLETSTDIDDQILEQERPQKFPSQVAGLIVSHGTLTPSNARDVLQRCISLSGRDFEEPIHGNRIPKGDGYDAIIEKLVTECLRKRWQPIRIVNLEELSYGDRVAVYTNLVAELVLRAFETKAQSGFREIEINLYYAVVMTGMTPKGQPTFIEPEDYKKRLTEYLTFIAVRRGFSKEASAWKIGAVTQRSANRSTEIQLCDLISNASFANFSKCGPIAAETLRSSFEKYDNSLHSCELTNIVDRYLAEDTLGLAVQTIAERMIQDNLAPEIQHGAVTRLELIVSRLASLGAPSRDSQFSVILSWIEQLIEMQRSLDLGRRLVNWLIVNLVEPLMRSLHDESDAYSIVWFKHGLYLQILISCNHLGALEEARTASKELNRLIPSLAGRWEHAWLLVRGLIAQSVHQIDCYEYSQASRRMESVVKYFESLADLFQFALPGIFPKRVRSDLRGQALGTWLQSELYNGLVDKSKINLARKLSENAIDEFTTIADKLRQYQYRCQIEIAAGKLNVAHDYLARSIKLAEKSDIEIAKAILEMTNSLPIAQGFTLLHWFRYGRAACLSSDHKKRDEFLSALYSSGVLNIDWCSGKSTTYPSHGILRQLAVIRAYEGKRDKSISSLRQLQKNLGSTSICALVPLTILIAATAEVAGLLWKTDTRHSRLLLGNQKGNIAGLLAMLHTLKLRCENQFPEMWHVFEGWAHTIEDINSGKIQSQDVQSKLLDLARPIGH